MSQTMRIPKINDSFYGEILTYFPDEEEAQEFHQYVNVADSLCDCFVKNF